MELSDDVIDDTEDMMATEEAADRGIPNAGVCGLAGAGGGGGQQLL